jgi:hypothetical protein
VIEQFVRELRARLPLVCRRGRVVEEVEEHLRSSARDVGEGEAVARFGTPDSVAASFRARAGRLYAALALVAALAFPVVTYPIPENELPPAPWPSADEMPSELYWKREGVLLLFAGACAFGGIAIVSYWWRRSLALWAAAVSLLSLAGVGVLGTVLSIQWRDHVMAAPAGLLVLGPLQFLIALAGIALLARAAVLGRHAMAG